MKIITTFCLLLLGITSGPVLLSAQVSALCNSEFPISYNDKTYLVPYQSNKDLHVQNNAVKRAIIFVHGEDREASSRYNDMISAANLSAVNLDTVLVITPQFLVEEDLTFHGLDSSYLFWTNVWNGWKYGYNNQSTGTFSNSARVSSFYVIDEMIKKIMIQNPNLERIVVAGHSAGGRFCQRYAAINTTETSNPCVQFLYVPMNAGTYLYMNNERRVVGTTNQFAIPTSCATYDQYNYGLSTFNGCPYAALVGSETIKNQFKNRTFALLNGQNDNDPNDPGIDNSDCKEFVQGANRLERATIFYNHILDYFGASITQNHFFDIIPNAGHSTYQMATSVQGRFRLFQWQGVAGYPLAINLTTASSLPGICLSFCTVNGGAPPFSYHWSNGETTNPAMNLPAGDFSVTVTDSQGCTRTGIDNCVLVSTTDLKDLVEISVSPNPSEGVFTLKASFPEITELDISIGNMLGRQVYSKTVADRTINTLIDIKGLPKGTYFLKLKTARFKEISRLIIIE